MKADNNCRLAWVKLVRATITTAECDVQRWYLEARDVHVDLMLVVYRTLKPKVVASEALQLRAARDDGLAAVGACRCREDA